MAGVTAHTGLCFYLRFPLALLEESYAMFFIRVNPVCTRERNERNERNVTEGVLPLFVLSGAIRHLFSMPDAVPICCVDYRCLTRG